MEIEINENRIIEMAKMVDSAHGEPILCHKPIQARVWGKMAGFFRPEYRVEKRTYDIPPYSALRNLFASIYWHPGMDVVPVLCGVKNPIRHEYIATNGVKEIKNIRKDGPVVLVSQRDVQQSTCEYLTNVEYYVLAYVVVRPEAVPEGESLNKYFGMLEKRIERGQYGKQPYFGTRECHLSFEPLQSEDWDKADFIHESRDYGLVNAGFDYSQERLYVPLMQRLELENGIVNYTKHPMVHL